MKYIGRFIKYLLRSVFSIIIFLLLVGWAKMSRDMGAYIEYLNTNDRSVFHRSQPATRGDPFRPGKQMTGDIADILSGDIVNTGISETSGLDVYDPQLEQDLNTITDTSLSGAEEDFGFTTTDQPAADLETASGPDSKADLLNLIKKRELQK